ncbi:MAG: PP0621 family protein [Campylobacterota bacterium]|nr:PP0621 family protein [Campylobacterota bacterium]
MILKFLLVVGVIAFVYFMFIKKKPLVESAKKETKSKDEVQSNDMVECAECGIYCDIDDSILSNNKYYCSQECLKKS